MQTTKSLKDKKKIISYFHTTKLQKFYFLACILALLPSLLKLWELGQYYKNTPKIFCFLLVSWIMNLYIKNIPDIKKVDWC